jgi:hypothetical protein
MIAMAQRSKPVGSSAVVNPGANLEQWQAAHARRSSNAAQPHKDKHREAKRGIGKGGRPRWSLTQET